MNNQFWMRAIISMAIGSQVLLMSRSALAATNTVQMSDFKFVPATLTINVGDTVTWKRVNGSHDIESDKPLFKSPPPPVVTFSFTFTEAGRFAYHCNPHVSRGMRGTIIVAEVANAPPAVNITTPTNGQMFIAPATVTIEVSATDQNGTISEVSFFLGTNLVGMANSAPYSLSVSNLSAGQYSLTATATDNSGGETTSAAVTIGVNERPNLTLTSEQQLADGKFQFRILGGAAGQTAVIHYSGDLTNWIPISTNVFPNTVCPVCPFIDFIDAESSTSLQRFYRAVLP